MAKAKTGVLNRMLGKKICFQGRFSWGVKERLEALTEAQQGVMVEDLDAKVDYLVLADLSGGKTVQKKAVSLNGKGAAIQVIDAGAFEAMVKPTAEEILAMIRAGRQSTGSADLFLKVVGGHRYRYYAQQQPAAYQFRGENLDGADLRGFDLSEIDFENCSFVGANLTHAAFGQAVRCDFSKCDGRWARFEDVSGSRFLGATLTEAHFNGVLADTDFSSAMLEKASIEYFSYGRTPLPATGGVVMVGAVLNSASVHGVHLLAPDFRGADLSGASLLQCALEAANLQKATLKGATMYTCKLSGTDLSGSNLQGANLAGADLTNCVIDGADLANCNLRGATLDGVNLAKAKNYDPNAGTVGSVGPALTELDQVYKKARRIEISFKVRSGTDGDDERVSVDSNGLQYGWGINLPPSMGRVYHHRHVQSLSMSDALLQMANALGGRTVRFETVEVSSTKSPKGGKELRDLVMQAIAEAFAVELPKAEDLAAATKAHREQVKDQTAADRERREKAKKAAEKEKDTAKKQIARKIAKQVGKVTDIATFLKALELRIEKPKIQKATKMLKASGFKLFNDVADDHLCGVVKSQTDPDLVYACRIDQDGHYACCTQNLNICGGLRGSICKHLLVLIIGLVQAGELDPSTIDSWVAKSANEKAELDKETMGAIFIKYKGAEAGEVDWRPTETVPEDYYAL